MYHSICRSIGASHTTTVDPICPIQNSQVLAIAAFPIFDQLTGQILAARHINTWISGKEISRFQLYLMNLDRPI